MRAQHRPQVVTGRLIGAILLLGSLTACSRADPARNQRVSAPAPVRVAESEPDLMKSRMHAFGKAVGTATDEDPELLNQWLTAETPHLTSPLPVVPVDSMGTLIPVSLTVSREQGWRVEMVQPNWWRFETLVNGQEYRSRTRSLAINEPADSPAINHYRQLPMEAEVLNGIAWALTELPDAREAGFGCLRDQLGLIVPEQTITRLEAVLGPIAVQQDGLGSLRLDFSFAGKQYYLFVQHKGPSRSTLLLSEDELADPGTSLTKKYAVQQPGRWTEIPDGLRGL